MNQRRGFTLVELLVVVTVIGVVIGLAFPAVNSALEHSKMSRDLHRSKQLGTVLTIQAQDNEGIYLQVNSEGGSAANSVEIFQNLIDQQYLSNRDTLTANRYESKTVQGSLLPEQVGWSYVAGMRLLNSSNLPLVISRNAVETLGDFRAERYVLQAEKNPWKSDAVLIFYTSGHAEALKADTKGEVVQMAPRDFPEGAFLLHPDSAMPEELPPVASTPAANPVPSGNYGGTLTIGGPSWGGTPPASSGTLVVPGSGLGMAPRTLGTSPR